MRRGYRSFAAALIVLAALALASPAFGMGQKGAVTQSALDLRNAMRALWEDHVGYTRAFIVSSLAGLDDVSQIAERLLRNQDDIGNAIKPIYGDAAGNALAGLLREHILIAAGIVAAAKSGDGGGVADGQTTWQANADQIADLLSGANPNWPRQTLVDMLYAHLSFTTEEVVAWLSKDWNGAIAAYDKGRMHMLELADALSAGIVKQFPDKFKA